MNYCKCIDVKCVPSCGLIFTSILAENRDIKIEYIYPNRGRKVAFQKVNIGNEIIIKNHLNENAISTVLIKDGKKCYKLRVDTYIFEEVASCCNSVEIQLNSCKPCYPLFVIDECGNNLGLAQNAQDYANLWNANSIKKIAVIDDFTFTTDSDLTQLNAKPDWDFCFNGNYLTFNGFGFKN